MNRIKSNLLFQFIEERNRGTECTSIQTYINAYSFVCADFARDHQDVIEEIIANVAFKLQNYFHHLAYAWG